MTGEPIESKALRLIEEGRVEIQCGNRQEGLAIVHGDSRDHLVSWDPVGSVCMCRIESRTVEHQGSSYSTFGIVWLGEVEIDGRGLLSDPDKRHTDSPTDRELARDVILDALEGAGRQWKDLLELLDDEGVSPSSAKRARDDLRRRGLIDKRKDGPSGGWWWYRRVEVDQVDQSQDPGQLGQQGQLGGSI